MLGEKYACEIPEVLKKFTLVTKGDAAIGAHSMYVSNLSETDIDPDTSASKTFDGHVWGGYIPPREERLEDGSIIYLRNITFNGDTTENVGLADAGIDWAHIEWLAQNLEDCGEHKPGPGILAPFSNVYLLGDAAYADGYIIASNFETRDGASNVQSSLQLHGYPFLGTGFTCKSTLEENPAPAPSPTPESKLGLGNTLSTTVNATWFRGIEIQIRTKLVRYWSYIQSVAIRIGKDFKYWYNFEYQANMDSLGGFPVIFKDRSKYSHYEAGLDIDLSPMFPGEKISVAAWKEFVRIDVKNGSKASFGKSVGILGEFESGRTLSRKGALMDDFVECGQEWQVLPTEPMLFHETSVPQFPAKCVEQEDP